MSSPLERLVTAACVALVLPACSIRSIAVNSLGNALAEGGGSLAKDDDPELVAQATPFGLKTMEALLEESPRHKGLLLAAASGFTRYAFAFVQQEADFVEEADLARATRLRERARGLYLRALGYGLRGLEAHLPGFESRLRQDPQAALARARRQHAPLLYWTAAAWGAAMSLAIDDSELVADQRLAEALARRALELDEGLELGAVHDFFISYEAARASVGGSIERAREHLERALALSRGRRAWPYITFAESASVSRQDREEFVRLLEQALSVDAARPDDQRLSNIVAHRRARWLLGRVDHLFIE